MSRKKKTDPNQLALFPELFKEEKKEPVKVLTGNVREYPTPMSFMTEGARHKKMVLEFAKRFRNSIAFEVCVEEGSLDENYHTNLAEKHWLICEKGNKPELTEDKKLMSWHRKNYKIIETRERVLIYK